MGVRRRRIHFRRDPPEAGSLALWGHGLGRQRLARCERQASARLITHLAELDARQLYRAGFLSFFVCCCEVLRLSEHETYNRIEAAQAGAEVPGDFSTSSL